MNTVIAGDHLYGTITYKNKKKGFEILNTSCLGLKKEKTYINKETVESWEIFEENGKKSFASGAARGIVGAAVLGPVGAIAGAATAKTKTTYKVSIVFKDGTKSLCELDNGHYKLLVQTLY